MEILISASRGTTPTHRNMEGQSNILSPNVASQLHCHMCSEFPNTPIILCEKGHSICSTCQNQYNKCSVCNKKYTSARNFPAEALLSRCTFKCKYWSNGCEDQVKGISFRNHITNCAFRPAYCNLNPCVSNPISIKTYPQHLRIQHAIDGKIVPSSICDLSLPQDFKTIQKRQKQFSLNGNIFSSPSYFILFAGELFLLHTVIKDNLIYWWVSIANNNHEVGIRFRSIIYLAQNNNIHKIKWTGLVYAADEGFQSLQQELVSVIPINTLKRIFGKNESPMPNESVAVIDESTVSSTDANMNTDDFNWKLIVYLEKVQI